MRKQCQRLEIRRLRVDRPRRVRNSSNVECKSDNSRDDEDQVMGLIRQPLPRRGLQTDLRAAAGFCRRQQLLVIYG